jgi:uncharacterized protein (TIGR02147 family)
MLSRFDFAAAHGCLEIEVLDLEYHPGDFLFRLLVKRNEKNPSYSMRSFARNLTISPSLLSRVLAKKKSLSEESVNLIAEKLKLKPDEANLLQLYAKFARSKSESTRKSLKEQIQSIQSTGVRYFEMEATSEKILSDHFSLALLCLLEIPKVSQEISDLAIRLKCSTVKIRNSIQALNLFGLIKEVAGKLKPTNEFRIFNARRSSKIMAYHRSNLTLAAQALEAEDFSKRDFSSSIFSFSPNDIERARQIISDCHRQLLSFSKSADSDGVYMFSTQVFRLDVDSLN